MSRSLTPPAETKVLDCATWQNFVGGPFHGRRYRESLRMPAGEPENTWSLTIPFGLDLVAALVWNQGGVKKTDHPRGSQPDSFVCYRNGLNGEWNYLPCPV